MLAYVSRTCVKCDDGTGCGRPKKGSYTNCFQAVSTFYCALSPAHGNSQTAASIMRHHSSGRVACEQCRKGTLMLDTQYSHLPVVLPLLTYAQQVTSAPDELFLTHVTICADLAIIMTTWLCSTFSTGFHVSVTCVKLLQCSLPGLSCVDVLASILNPANCQPDGTKWSGTCNDKA